jgi:hypothetical protein
LFIYVLLGCVIGYIVRLLEERRAELKRMRRMLDRYIANAQANLVLQSDEFWRLGMLQKVGAAELNERELSLLCRRIVITDYKTLDIEKYLLSLKITASL